MTFTSELQFAQSYTEYRIYNCEKQYKTHKNLCKIFNVDDVIINSIITYLDFFSLPQLLPPIYLTYLSKSPRSCNFRVQIRKLKYPENSCDAIDTDYRLLSFAKCLVFEI